jgi:hypothetical protein
MKENSWKKGLRRRTWGRRHPPAPKKKILYIDEKGSVPYLTVLLHRKQEVVWPEVNFINPFRPKFTDKT